MASSKTYTAILINENQVPGAVLQPFKDIGGHSNTQLKRWLQCRGLPVGGKKEDLIKRVQNAIDNKNTDIVPYIDNGHWYDLALAASKNAANYTNNNDVVPIPPFPVTGWKIFPSNKIPNNFNYGIIYHHLIESAVIRSDANENNKESDEENNSPEFDTAKPLRKGRIFFKSGHIQNMKDFAIKNNYCLKSTVMSSFRENVHYNVMVMLDNACAKVLDSSCECAASSMGRCSHVAGLLFALEDYVITFGYEPVSCTSKLCAWNVGRKRKKDASTIMERKYSNKIEPKLKSIYVPVEIIDDPSSLNNKLLYNIQYNNISTMWATLLDFKYHDYELTNDRKYELTICVQHLRQNLTFNCDRPTELSDTNLQYKSEKWINIRVFLLTASDCKIFFTIQPKNYFSRIKNKLWYSNNVIKNKYTEHGNNNENFARVAYAEKTGHHVQTTGLWINPKYPGLGASPDGLVYDSDTQSYGILEIKCPFILKNNMPSDLSNLTATQRNAFCATVDSDGKLHLKVNHQYYFQIQMQLAILEREWCDFTIWTFVGIHIERVYFNMQLWENIFQKLNKFHRDVLCPEYFEMRIPRKLQPFNLDLC